jgi:hypothetical protein
MYFLENTLRKPLIAQKRTRINGLRNIALALGGFSHEIHIRLGCTPL